MKKKIGSAIIAAGILFTATPTSPVIYASTVQQQSIYLAQANFAKAIGVNIKTISAPLLYDINNDGSNEIIISSKEEGQYYIRYVGIYAKDGRKLLIKDFNDLGVVELQRVKNTTNKNCLLTLTAGASSTYFDIYAFKDNKLQQLLAGGAVQFPTIKDSDKDGNDEIYGEEFYYSSESNYLSRASGIYDKVVFQWVPAKKKYIKYVYGQDGIRDDLRKKVGTITSQEALNLLSEARNAQLSMNAPIATNTFIKKMAPIFTYNFLDSLVKTSFNDKNDTSLVYPSYLISDDYSSLIPEFNPKKKATFKLTADMQSATIAQAVQENFEGDVYNVTYEATLLKTKYGWKIDSFSGY